MGTGSRALCVILTIWMVSSRPLASIRPESPDSGGWWGTQESKQILEAAGKARLAGDFTAAESFYQQGYDSAKQVRNVRAMIKFLNGIAGCRLVQFRYRAALDTWIEAKRRAQAIGDHEDHAVIAFNLSSLYLQVWDFDSALSAAEEGRMAMASVQHPSFLPQSLLQLARLHEYLHDGRAANLYREGIEAAHARNDPVIEGMGWELLGVERLQQKQFKESEAALKEAIRLREKYSPNNLGFPWGALGELKLAENDIAGAEQYTNLAISAGARRGGANAPGTWPQYRLLNQRGRIRMAKGEIEAALKDLRAAVEQVEKWRVEVLPASSTLTAANEQLEKRVFDSFIEASAKEAIRTGDSRWTAESLAAVERNRAASLRESLVLANVWRRKVPAEYWETLARLRAVEARAVRSQQEDHVQENPRVQENESQPGLELERDRLRLRLTEMEAKAGLGLPLNNSESFHSQTSLIHFQLGLGDKEVLLSFHLGEQDAYLWSVTRKSLRLYKLPEAKEIRAKVEVFRDAVRAGSPDVRRMGEQLYQMLFGQLSPEAVAKPSWLLSIEGSLFELPFAALTERQGGKMVYLVQKHSLQVVPGAWLLSKRPGGTKGGWFLGVGDPIYNAADPRWKKTSKGRAANGLWRSLIRGWVTNASARVEARRQVETMQFVRIPGSGKEVTQSALSWQASAAFPAVILEGAEARREQFTALLNGDNPPSIIHLATHVVTSETRRDRAFVAFSLGPQEEAEFLSSSDVAALHVPGTLVVMTGCESGTGDVRAGTGLLGLTRAWQIAGASAIVSTAWPVKDSKGDIFPNFYRWLRKTSAAEALQRSQLEMIESGTWCASPACWAAYQVTGGAR